MGSSAVTAARPRAAAPGGTATRVGLAALDNGAVLTTSEAAAVLGTPRDCFAGWARRHPDLLAPVRGGGRGQPWAW